MTTQRATREDVASVLKLHWDFSNVNALLIGWVQIEREGSLIYAQTGLRRAGKLAHGPAAALPRADDTGRETAKG